MGNISAEEFREIFVQKNSADNEFQIRYHF